MTTDFYKAYAQLLNSINTIKKNSDNPYYKSKYADLSSIFDEVKERILENGFVLLQTPVFKDGRNFLNTKILHLATGEFLEGEVELLTVKPDMQQLGSAITYARRYCILPMLNIEVKDGEDDDGNLACGFYNEFSFYFNKIKEATNEKFINKLWYEWKDKFDKDSDEYKELTKLSSNVKNKLQNPSAKIDILSGLSKYIELENKK